MNRFVRPLKAGGLFFLAALLLPAVAFGQALPTPADFVRNLDLRCYRINNPAPGINLRLDHLNPVFVNMGLPFEVVNVGPAQHLCVPVFKNNVPPSPTSLPFIRFVDWKCHAIQGPALNLPLVLNQLNPTIANLLGPQVNVVVREPQQLCVPVRKNNAAIPAAVVQLVRWLDVKCYRVDTGLPTAPITLTHLNPLIAGTENVIIFPPPPAQLCVPVTKNQVVPPNNVLPIIRFSDVLCLRINGQPLNRNFVLSHLNPVLQGLPPENVVATTSEKLCVPVAKNGFFPPG